MRHLIVLAAVSASACFVLLPSGAGGAAVYPPGLVRTIAVDLLGTSADPAGAVSELSTRPIAGTVRGSLGPGSYSGMLTNTGFLEPPPVCFVCGQGQRFGVGGTVTIALRNGSLTATVDPDSEGSLLLPSHFVELDFDLHLTVTDGTRRYQHAHGSLTLEYRSLTQEGGPGCDPGAPGDTCGIPSDLGSATGSLTFAPTSVR